MQYNNSNLKELIQNWSKNPTDIHLIKLIENADTSKVTTMAGLFRYRDNFNLDISAWDVSSVTNMSFMFYGAESFNQDISSWDVSSCASMWSMFYKAKEFNQDISNWQVGLVKDMDSMFESAKSFDQDIGAWDISQVTSLNNIFKDSPLLEKNLLIWLVKNESITLQNIIKNIDQANLDNTVHDIFKYLHDKYKSNLSNTSNQVEKFDILRNYKRSKNKFIEKFDLYIIDDKDITTNDEDIGISL
jgi:surface protein